MYNNNFLYPPFKETGNGDILVIKLKAIQNAVVKIGI